MSRLFSVAALLPVQLVALSLTRCAGTELPLPPRPDQVRSAARPQVKASLAADVASSAEPLEDADADPALSTSLPEAAAPPPRAELAPTGVVQSDSAHCAGVPPRGPDGAPPRALPHLPLGGDLDIPGDRPAYVLLGDDDDPRVIVYLHGWCGDATAADHFREAVRENGTLLALRGDTPCAGDRFKWRDDASRIQARISKALQRLAALRGGAKLATQRMLLFGYSQGAERAEKVAARYPTLFPRVVLGGPPTPPSPLRLAHTSRVAVFGGELETTENMRAGANALRMAGISSRYFSLDCAYHGHFGTRAEAQLSEVLAWVNGP